MTAALPDATVTVAHVGTRALQAAVFTNDLAKVRRAFHELDLAKQLDLPVFVENDCNVCTLGVHQVELKGKPKHMIGIFIGSPINIPVKRIPRTESMPADPLALFGLAGRWPSTCWGRSGCCRPAAGPCVA